MISYNWGLKHQGRARKKQNSDEFWEEQMRGSSHYTRAEGEGPGRVPITLEENQTLLEKFSVMEFAGNPPSRHSGSLTVGVSP